MRPSGVFRRQFWSSRVPVCSFKPTNRTEGPKLLFVVITAKITQVPIQLKRLKAVEPGSGWLTSFCHIHPWSIFLGLLANRSPLDNRCRASCEDIDANSALHSIFGIAVGLSRSFDVGSDQWGVDCLHM